MRTGVRRQHVALNVAKLVNARQNPELDRDIRTSDIVGIDGMGIVWALRLFGEKRAVRVTGIDLFEQTIGLCAKEGFRPFLLGATPEVLAAAEAELKRRHPPSPWRAPSRLLRRLAGGGDSATRSPRAARIASSWRCRPPARSASCCAIASGFRCPS